MTEAEKPAGASFSGTISRTAVSRKKVTKAVKRLQMRIAKAVREGKYGKAKALQRILTHSYYAKLIRTGSIGIRRHIKIKAEANPSDLKFTDYFRKRKSGASKQASVFK